MITCIYFQQRIPWDLQETLKDESLDLQSTHANQGPATVGGSNSMTKELRSALMEMCARTGHQTDSSR